MKPIASGWPGVISPGSSSSVITAQPPARTGVTARRETAKTSMIRSADFRTIVYLPFLYIRVYANAVTLIENRFYL
jgi:hypothetical protein